VRDFGWARCCKWAKGVVRSPRRVSSEENFPCSPRCAQRIGTGPQAADPSSRSERSSSRLDQVHMCFGTGHDRRLTRRSSPGCRIYDQRETARLLQQSKILICLGVSIVGSTSPRTTKPSRHLLLVTCHAAPPLFTPAMISPGLGPIARRWFRSHLAPLDGDPTLMPNYTALFFLGQGCESKQDRRRSGKDLAPTNYASNSCVGISQPALRNI